MIKDLKNIINNEIEKLKKFFVGTVELESKSQVRKKQYLNLLLVGLGIILAIFVLIAFLMDNSNKKTDMEELSQALSGEANSIELGGDGVKAETKWQNFLEESIEEESNKRTKQIDILKNTLTDTTKTHKEEVSKEFDELKSRLAYALNEIDKLKAENQTIHQDLNSLTSNPIDELKAAELGITSVIEDIETKAPVSSYNHIPATSYVSGHLLGGIAVSTAVNSASEPIPVVIKLTDRGNLPAKFAVDIKQCRLLASCYGEISSERAIIRAEELICEDKKAGLITSTKVAGVIYGDDGANGIRGTVVSMSEKHLKNAFIGGVLSGFSNTAKGSGGEFNVTSLGAVSTKKRGIKDMAGEGLLGGTSSAAEKLADYHIRLAENISPVILVPGGTKVDVMFTRSVQIGSFDIESAIKQERE